ncbi:DUF6950 family protein [Paradevosia shaoguanensis]|uniref:DUF6950 domain-containing protein n=1 Tax=Paradevosia shaoguanensis TaxID=1335043 RepID=A0AA41UIC6_9HYPH|nr:hypothetical protein [Paradevosia shaoguanensis]MCF1744723.1 hypothetical protein [Paradevosia shaoguanensis]MCI0129206.1 hypothetical protein [Paradevosia shaoguanensis]
MMVLARLPGWHARLDALIDSYRRAELSYGHFDCAILAALNVEALTGERIGKKAWWRYRSAEAGLRTMARAGFANLADMAASLLPEHEHPSRAYVGDIAAIPAENAFGFALGIVGGERIFVLGEGYDGLGTVDLLTATRAFKVG